METTERILQLSYGGRLEGGALIPSDGEDTNGRVTPIPPVPTHASSLPVGRENQKKMLFCGWWRTFASTSDGERVYTAVFFVGATSGHPKQSPMRLSVAAAVVSTRS